MYDGCHNFWSASGKNCRGSSDCLEPIYNFPNIALKNNSWKHLAFATYFSIKQLGREYETADG